MGEGIGDEPLPRDLRDQGESDHHRPGARRKQDRSVRAPRQRLEEHLPKPLAPFRPWIMHVKPQAWPYSAFEAVALVAVNALLGCLLLPCGLQWVLVVVGWALSGRIFGYSDTWQFVFNTSTTIVTFLIVFLIDRKSVV